jgi:hypothetical protein
LVRVVHFKGRQKKVDVAKIKYFYINNLPSLETSNHQQYLYYTYRFGLWGNYTEALGQGQAWKYHKYGGGT